jgi:CTP synthase (UTP-ammonia lyase)
MRKPLRIGLIGDYNENVVAHVAIPKALQLAGQGAGLDLLPVWMPTSSLGPATDFSPLAGLWCVPASPYENMAGALLAIRFARESNLPFFGTCGGFQHALIEYARNVLGMVEADHAESNPGASLPFVSPLACSLSGATGTVYLKPGSRAAAFYDRLETREAYNCNYGLNPKFHALLETANLQVTGWDEHREARIVELDGHPFFLATLFQPERSALNGTAHPLIVAFVRSLAARP